MIVAECSEWNRDGYVWHDDLSRFHTQYVQSVLTEGKGELTSLEHDVVQSLREHDVLSQNLGSSVADKSTLGQRFADRVASFGSSWTFILIFGGVLTERITINSIAMLGNSFDPLPFILLNLVLSCLAVIQAPAIMMSQNRQETKDRLRAENDYRVNLKAEREIRHLHTKPDLLLTHQWSRLLEMRQVQADLLEEIGKSR